jgi:hydrogenase nickel incorporation protein HypA/HybF
MHELAICQALIEQVERVARDNGAGRVLSITISVGPLAGVEPKLLEHAYPLAAAGTVAEDAQLVIETIAVQVRCRKCQAETAVVPNRLLCGTCNDWQVDVIAGDEMLLQRVEIEPAPERVDEPVH